MATTVQNFVNSVLRLIGVLDSGETPSSDMSDDAFSAANQMILNWSAAGMPVYQVSRDTLAMTGAVSYTIGPSGTISTTRPVLIKSAQVSFSGVSQPAQVVTSDVWVQPKDRSLTGHFAQQLYYDGGYPLGTIALWPTPTSGSTLEIYSLKPLTAFTSLSATIDLPPGYEHAMRFALASVLAGEYGAVLSEEVQRNAAQAMASIGALNSAVLGPAIAPPPQAPAAA